ncbi:MAG: RNA methyltransferase, partial [Rhodospirillaceae bacterium]|nr:RNA methyltransferase [Rhodospirillaceae bacterium]
GQAVLLVAYEWFTAGPLPEAVIAGDSLPATLDELAYFENRLEAELLEKGFLKPPEKRPSMMRNLRNIFRRADLTGQEVRSLHGVISALIRREGDSDD